MNQVMMATFPAAAGCAFACPCLVSVCLPAQSRLTASFDDIRIYGFCVQDYSPLQYSTVPTLRAYSIGLPARLPYWVESGTVAASPALAKKLLRAASVELQIVCIFKTISQK